MGIETNFKLIKTFLIKKEFSYYTKLFLFLFKQKFTTPDFPLKDLWCILRYT